MAISRELPASPEAARRMMTSAHALPAFTFDAPVPRYRLASTPTRSTCAAAKSSSRYVLAMQRRTPTCRPQLREAQPVL
eukprot:5609963-Pleurochrysis_carterae.AAC.1